MVVALSKEKKIRLYASPETGEFGRSLNSGPAELAPIPLFGNARTCFHYLNQKTSSDATKWVLIVNVDPSGLQAGGGPNTSSAL